MPVFELASLLGTAEDSQAPRWLILSTAPHPIAFAFSQFDGFVRALKNAFHPAASLDATRPYLTEFVSTSDGPRALIDVPLLVAALRTRLGPSRPGSSHP